MRPQRERKDLNILECIPEEIFYMILKILELSDLCSISQTCQKLYHMTRNPLLWTDITIDWKSIKKRRSLVHGLLSRASKIVNLQVENRNYEKVDTQRIIDAVKQASNSLKSLKFSFDLYTGVKLKSNAVMQLGTLTQLTCLEFDGGCLTSKLVKEIAKLEKLERLKIPYASNLIPQDLIHLFSKLKYLRSVKISSCGTAVNDEVVISLVKNNPHLESINIDNSQLFTGEAIKDIFENCPNILYLTFSSCLQITNSSLLNMFYLPSSKLSYIFV